MGRLPKNQDYILYTETAEELIKRFSLIRHNVEYFDSIRIVASKDFDIKGDIIQLKLSYCGGVYQMYCENSNGSNTTIKAKRLKDIGEKIYKTLSQFSLLR